MEMVGIGVGIPELTRVAATGNTAVKLSELLELNEPMRRNNSESPDDPIVSSAFITCEEFAVRYAFRDDPTQDGFGHLLLPGESIRLVGAEVHICRVISATDSEAGVLQITLYV